MDESGRLLVASASIRSITSAPQTAEGNDPAATDIEAVVLTVDDFGRSLQEVGAVVGNFDL
jgi:hypothetical protein